MKAVLLALLLLVMPQGLHAAAIADIAISADRITLRFTAPVEKATSFTLADPMRIVVDVDDARAGSSAPSGGMVSATRQAQNRPDRARIVFDLARPAIAVGGAMARDGRSLSLPLKDVTQAAFLKNVKAQRLAYRAPPPSSGAATVRMPIDPPKPGRGLPPVIGAKGSDRPLVVIDPGHGGHDPGSLSADARRREKDVALTIARAVRDELVASGRVRVAMTRNDDRFLILGERREIARRLGADLFLSIHADSAENHDARGATVYTLSEVASDRVAAELARRENRADILNGVNLGGENADVSSILLDLAQRETMNISASFATLLQREMAVEGIPFKNEYHRFAGLVVLKAPDVPSVLLETGYISNAEDEELLFSRAYQKKIATGVRRAIETHFARRLAAR